jgi:hypothetical protein
VITRIIRDGVSAAHVSSASARRRNQDWFDDTVACVRPGLGRHKMLDPLIKRSKIFGVEIHSRFDTESIEIGRQPLVGPRAPHVVKMQ